MEQPTSEQFNPPPLRILHVSWEFPPVMYGGLGRHVEALAVAQAEAGHEVVVLTQHGDRTADDDVYRGVRVIRARESEPQQPRTFDNLLPWVEAMEGAMTASGTALVELWRPDVVHGHDWVVTHASYDIARAADCPVAVTVHATEAGRHGGWIVGALSREVHRREWTLVHEADATIVCSNAMRTEVQQAFGALSPAPIVVRNGVDLNEWSAPDVSMSGLRHEWGASDDAPLVVCSGRLAWEKGFGTAIDAAAILLPGYPDLRLVIAGRGPLEAELEAQVAMLRLGGTVRFAGFLPEDRLRSLVAAADCVVVPSRYEPFGLVAVEASALGTPVVASDVGGLGEIIIDGLTGHLVPPADATALAEGIAAVLDAPTASEVMALAARRRVAEEFTWPRIARQCVDVYWAAVASGRSSRPQAAPPPDTDRNVLTGELAG